MNFGCVPCMIEACQNCGELNFAPLTVGAVPFWKLRKQISILKLAVRPDFLDGASPI